MFVSIRVNTSSAATRRSRAADEMSGLDGLVRVHAIMIKFDRVTTEKSAKVVALPSSGSFAA
jgi:hypothetical protein